MEFTPVFVDFSQSIGPVKPLNAVNNGPTGSNVRGSNDNRQDYRDLGLPYARLHDSAFYYGYGGEFAVDVHRIFEYFDADENDPASYRFGPTDKYLANIVSVGTKIYYRLGASIEHEEKKGTYPPRDFAKWARICEHIIRHYNEGWANGFRYGIEYWEIWNEPDCRNRDGSNPCWQGTDEQFEDLYAAAATHLKACFPHLKIGGPAFTSSWTAPAPHFLSEMKKRGVPLDFFSYHWYGNEMRPLAESMRKARDLLDTYGFDKTETILNEWNYIRGWFAEEWTYSLRAETSAKGASFIAAAMAVGQQEPLDMLMYYDARPGVMNGIFNAELKRLPGFAAFEAFSAVAKYKHAFATPLAYDDGLYTLGAKDEEGAALFLTYYRENDEAPSQTVKAEIRNPFPGQTVAVECLLPNEAFRYESVREEIFSADRFSVYLKMPLFTTYLIRIRPLK